MPADGELFKRLYRETGGNPLALLEAVPALRSSSWAGQVSAGPLPVGSRLTAAYSAQLTALPEPSRRAVTVAAASYTDDAAVLMGALRALALDADVLQVLETAGLIELSGGKVMFAHPLLRASAYHTAAPDQRRQAHRALAGALTDRDGAVDRDQRSWHDAAAAVGPDPTAAAAVADTAARARARGALPAARRAYERAAALAPSPSTKPAICWPPPKWPSFPVEATRR